MQVKVKEEDRYNDNDSKPVLQEKQNVAVNIVKPELTITSLAAGTIPEGATVSTPPLSCTWGSVR